VVSDDIEEGVIALVRKYMEQVIFGKAKVISTDSDIDTDLDIDWPETEEMMEEFFNIFRVERGGFDIKIYYPEGPSIMISLKDIFRKEKKGIVCVPDFTIRMLIESAKARRWLYADMFARWG
jgi:hypothetical protein